ncbi:MAG: hypothetical protein KGL69_04090, partial [Alphaproteobacteria bacterium]|nr:hypothetical protein [Alphaproteobacteria bacterium]
MSDAEAHAKGLADAPALLKTAGIDCQVEDARFLGAAGAKAKVAIYEVACVGAEGFVLARTSPVEVASATCLEMARPM